MLNTVIDKVAYRIPQSISELSLGKYLQLQYPQLTEIEQVGIVLDGKRNAFTALPYTSQLEQSISNTMRLLGDVLESINDFRDSLQRIALPANVTLRGQLIRVPQDIGPEPFGARMRVKQLIKETINNPNATTDTIMPDILAHYLFTPFVRTLDKNARYNEYQAEEFKEVVNELPLDTAIQLTNFFLSRSPEYFKSKFSHWLTNLKLWSYRRAWTSSASTATLTP
jgi:hypothetical protein